MTAIGPCLTFYVRHAAEVDNLIELRAEGKLKPGDDSSLFNEVYERASLDAYLLMGRLLATGGDAASAQGLSVEGTKASDIKSGTDYWEAFRYLALDGKQTTVFVEVGIWQIRNRVSVVPAVGLAKGDLKKVADLRNLLAANDFAIDPPSWWAKEGWDHYLPIGELALCSDTTVEELEAGCRKAFEAIGPHLRAVVEFAAGGGK